MRKNNPSDPVRFGFVAAGETNAAATSSSEEMMSFPSPVCLIFETEISENERKRSVNLKSSNLARHAPSLTLPLDLDDCFLGAKNRLPGLHGGCGYNLRDALSKRQLPPGHCGDHRRLESVGGHGS